MVQAEVAEKAVEISDERHVEVDNLIERLANQHASGEIEHDTVLQNSSIKHCCRK